MPKILVADDNANIQKMVALSFEDRGVEVVSVGNGEAAVRRIPDVKPDLVLADIFMPVRNGYEVCEFVKKDSRFSHVPVILLVGAFDPLDEREARRVGADGVLKKPFVPPDPLIAMVMSALEKNPKVAAELAKAREAKQAPPPPPPESILEPATSPRAELKPLPTFPEPTPEEEALLYSTGSGRRMLDDMPTEDRREPQPPAGEFEEPEFDGTSTARDWRRNAMDIEVPAEAANTAAFMTDDRFDPSVFPSERDVPPRRVPEPVEETLGSEAPTPAESQIPPAWASADSFPPSGSETFPAETSATHWAPSEAPITDSAPPQPSHWMDQLAQGSLDLPPSDWMSLLSKQTDFTSPAEPRAEKPSESEEAPIGREGEEQSFLIEEPASSLPTAAGDEASTVPDQETIEQTAIESVPVSRGPEASLEVDSEPQLPVAYKDPDLVEPPAVQVTPDPLLEEEPAAQAQYGTDFEATDSFAPPAFPPAAEEPPVTEERTPSLEPSPSVEAQPVESEPSERVPTGPPPNREALAEIPFLAPPPDFYKQQSEQAPARAADSATVDTVVQKVLEKLQPQLQDLLSQGVLKPLVESLLQNELTKKDE